MPRKDREIQAELDEIRDWLGETAEEMEDFEDWYAALRRQYGKPSEEALQFLKEGDFVAFEQFVRDGYEPPLR